MKGDVYVKLYTWKWRCTGASLRFDFKTLIWVWKLVGQDLSQTPVRLWAHQNSSQMGRHPKLLELVIGIDP
jgi:hypothetical protein